MIIAGVDLEGNDRGALGGLNRLEHRIDGEIAGGLALGEIGQVGIHLNVGSGQGRGGGAVQDPAHHLIARVADDSGRSDHGVHVGPGVGDDITSGIIDTVIIAGVDLEGDDRGALGFHGSIHKHSRPGDVGGVGIVEVHDFIHGVEGEGKTRLFGFAVPVVGPVREYLARRSGHGRRVQLGVSGGGIGGVVYRLAGIGIIRPAAPVVVEHYDDFLLLSLFARRSSIVGDIRILCEFLIQLRTRIGLDGGLIF